MINNLKYQIMSYAGHIMRNTSGHYDTLLRTIDGRRQGKRGKGEHGLNWHEMMQPDKETRALRRNIPEI